jgi:Phospholipase_D-nuclease N-terminal
MFALLSIVGALLLLLLIPFGLACFAFWVWMLIHAIRNDQVTGTTRVLWVALVWFLPLIGSVIYFFTGRKAVGALRTA